MAQNPTARTLTLLGLLQSQPRWPAGTLAARLGVSARTLRRDVDRLRQLGYGVVGRPGPGASYRLVPGATVPPLLFTVEEVSAVVAGLRLVQPLLGGDAAATALVKLQQVLPPALARHAGATDAATDVLAHSDAAAAAGNLAAVTAAVTDNGRIRFDYADKDARRSRRTVDPVRQVLRDERWYLVGYDVDRDDWRLFRLDRVTALERVPGTYARRDFPADSVQSWLATDFARPAAVEISAGTEVDETSDRLDRTGRSARAT